jgi:hypothetical protein
MRVLAADAADVNAILGHASPDRELVSQILGSYESGIVRNQ